MGNKNKGCCGCLGIGCGGILLVLIIIGFIGFKFLSPIINQVKFFAEDEVCVKIFEIIKDNQGENLDSNKIMELNTWLSQNGYTVEKFDIDNQQLVITKPNYELKVDGWNWNYSTSNGKVNETGRINISLIKDGKMVRLSSDDIKQMFNLK